jgi:hypothetical protein
MSFRSTPLCGGRQTPQLTRFSHNFIEVDWKSVGVEIFYIIILYITGSALFIYNGISFIICIILYVIYGFFNANDRSHGMLSGLKLYFYSSPTHILQAGEVGLTCINF